MTAVGKQAGFQLLDDVVGNKQQAVTFKWLAREAHIPYDVAKAMLFEFFTKHKTKLHATFLLAGWAKADNGPCHKVCVVKGEDLEHAKAGLKLITSMHVYSVGPGANQNSSTLANLQYEQSTSLFNSSLEDYIQTQKFSAVQGSSLKSVSHPPKQAAPKLEPVEQPQPPIKQEQKVQPAVPAVVQPSGEIPKVKQRKTTAAGKKKPASKSAMASTAPAPKPASRSGRGHFLDSDSESEDDQEVRPLNANLPASTENKEQGVAQLSSASNEDGVKAPSSRQAQAESSVAEARGVKRVMKTYYNDAGEEVTEMVEEMTDGGSDAADHGPKAPPSTAPHLASSQETKKAAAASKKTKSAGQCNIMSFFGAK